MLLVSKTRGSFIGPQQGGARVPAAKLKQYEPMSIIIGKKIIAKHAVIIFYTVKNKVVKIATAPEVVSPFAA